MEWGLKITHASIVQNTPQIHATPCFPPVKIPAKNTPPTLEYIQPDRENSHGKSARHVDSETRRECSLTPHQFKEYFTVQNIEKPPKHTAIVVKIVTKKCFKKRRNNKNSIEKHYVGRKRARRTARGSYS